MDTPHAVRRKTFPLTDERLHYPRGLPRGVSRFGEDDGYKISLWMRGQGLSRGVSRLGKDDG